MCVREYKLAWARGALASCIERERESARDYIIIIIKFAPEPAAAGSLRPYLPQEVHRLRVVHQRGTLSQIFQGQCLVSFL